MSDETNNPWTSTGAPGDTPQNPSPEPAATDRVGFCQDCGRPLTSATIRNVGTGVFCEPCLAARVGAPNPTPGYTTVPPYAPVSPQAAVYGEPHPVLAGFLGIIPGAGACYNGQYAKGLAHLVIFVILISLSSNVNGIFGLFVACWWIYMVVEAYITAKARLNGLPLPNAFGLNDIGERMGFGKNWNTVPTVKVAPAGTSPTPDTPVPPAPGYVPYVQASAGTSPDWVGYVPPTAFGSAAAPQQAYADALAAQIREQALRDAGYSNQPPYAPTYAGPATTNPYAAPNPYAVNVPPADILAGKRRFPVGAFWLICLGVVILLANVIPDWQMSERWWPPILLAGLSSWLFARRLRSGANIICIIRWPMILMVLAVMLALHAANVAVTFGLTCAVLLILFGGLLLLERTVGAGPLYSAPAATSGYTSVVPPSEPEAPRAAWSEPKTDTTQEDHHS